MTILKCLALISLVPALALAQSPGTPSDAPDAALRAALEDLGDGSRIRVVMKDKRVLEGRYSGHDLRELSVTGEDRPHRVLLVEVDSVEKRQWLLTSGMAKGGITGAVVGGLVIGGFIAVFCASDDGACPGAIPISAGVVGLGGVILGGAVGIVSHRWRPIYDPHPKSPTESRFPDRRAGTIWLRGGAGVLYVPDVGFDRAGPGLEAAIELGGRGRWSVAGEIGHYDIVNAGSLSRVGLETEISVLRAPWRPYAVAGAGLYVEDDPLLGYNVGPGLTYAFPGRFLLNAEFRYHGKMVGPKEFDMFSLTVGAGYVW